MSGLLAAALKPWHVMVAGIIALAVAMGIGRFAFTPLLPMMLADGVIDLHAASWLASANYLGYMLGALLCTLQPWLWARFSWLPSLAYSTLVRAGLLATGVLTLAMAWQAPGAWPGLRFAAGMTSGVVFITTVGLLLGPPMHRLMHRFHMETTEKEQADEDAQDGKKKTRGATKRDRAE